MTERHILHIDLDAFFASVEQRDDPSLRGKPVLVGGTRERGVVAAASYEARRYGVHSAMPMAEALRRCPRAIVVQLHMDRYQEASRLFFAILSDFSPLVEELSIDEAFVDATGMEKLLGDAEAIAVNIRARVRSELNLIASIGIAPNKFVAKIASALGKPDGLLVVRPERLLDFLHPLPVSKLWGVGKVSQEKLTSLGLRSIGDVAAFPLGVLERKLGSAAGRHLHRLAHGLDDRQLETRRTASSIGHEETFERDVSDKRQLATILLRQADRVARRLRKSNSRARTVVLKIKFADFQSVTRRKTLADASSDASVLYDTACSLLAEIPIDDERGKSGRVRLCGLSAANLEERDAPRQLGFAEEERARGERLGEVCDAITDRFGDTKLMRASHKRQED